MSEDNIEEFLEACNLTDLYELSILLPGYIKRLEAEQPDYISELDRASIKHSIIINKTNRHEAIKVNRNNNTERY